MTLFTKRTGEKPPQDATRAEFLNSDGTPIAWQVDECGRVAPDITLIRLAASQRVQTGRMGYRLDREDR